MDDNHTKGAACAVTPAKSNVSVPVRPGAIAGTAAGSGTPVTTLLQGFNSFTVSACDQAVTGSSGSTGGTERCDYTVCYSYDQLRVALNMSASAGDDFGDGSVSAKAQFIAKLNLTSTSVVVAIYANKITAATAVQTVRLLGHPPQDLNTFFQTYGDSYVDQIVLGAEYIALYVFYAQSQSDQLVIRAALSANQLSESGDLTVDLQSSFMSFSTSVNMRQAFNQTIFGVTNQPLPPSDQIVTFALGFASLNANSPTIISYSTQGYESVPGIIPFGPIVATRNLYLGYTGQLGISDYIATLSLLENQVSVLQEVYATYGYTGDSNLTIKGAQVRADLKALGLLVQQILADPTQSYTAGNYPSLGYGTPQLQASISSPVIWGGDGGQYPYADITPASIFQQVRILSLQLWGGWYLTGLSVTYGSTNAVSATVMHGNTNAAAGIPVTFAQDEFITVVNGCYGDYVNQLGFATSLDRTVPAFPPDGVSQPAPNAIQWPVPDGWFFLGFQGRYGSDLDQIQPVIGQINPAIWS
jgi:hypothetical protein